MLVALAQGLGPGRVEDDNPALNPLGVPALGSVPARILDVVEIACAGVTLLGIASLVVRWRRGSEETRRSLSWLVLGCLLAVVFAGSGLLTRGCMPYVVGSQLVPLLAIAPMVVIGVGRLGAPDWLAKSLIAAYRSLGARGMADWTVNRVDGAALVKLAGR